MLKCRPKRLQRYLKLTKLGLYVHIPFCKKKCDYCDFYSVNFDDQVADKYVETVITEMLAQPKLTADTLYFGGGTPSVLGAKRLIKILKIAQEKFDLSGEITLEANPNSVNYDMLTELYQGGFNRVSFGVQSGVDEELVALGRTHTSKDAEIAVNHAKSAGFANISVDLMLGIPKQTSKSLETSLKFMQELVVKHISAYMLKIEQNTPFYRQNIAINDDLMADMYLKTAEHLTSYGMEHYEISNFAAKGHKSRHNLKYWKSEQYLGFGPSAHSYYNGTRYCHNRDLGEYIETAGKNYVETSGEDSFFDYAMLRLRLSEGLDLAKAREKFPIDIKQIINRAGKFEKAQLLEIKGDTIKFTPRGFLLSNTLIVEILG